jgi:hypothetical protein
MQAQYILLKTKMHGLPNTETNILYILGLFTLPSDKSLNYYSKVLNTQYGRGRGGDFPPTYLHIYF